MVIFDCDGVLVDSERISARVGAGVLRRLGWDLDEAEVLERFLGCSDDYFAATVESHLGRPLPAGWAAQVQPLYEAAYDAELAAVEGVGAVLEALRSWGVRACVASNGSHAKVAGSLERCGLADEFTGRVFSAQDVAAGKPAPDLFLHAAASMGVVSDHVVVIEDSPPGVAAARAAGMHCLAYAALTPAALLEGAGTVICRSMDDVRHQLRTMTLVAT